MSLETLKSHLSLYHPSKAEEDTGVVARFTDLIDKEQDKALIRSTFESGHIVASGLVTDPEAKMILLNHHKSLKLWLAFGGHLDGETNAEFGARREVIEESGLENPVLLTPQIIDLDIHTIPANPKRDEPKHLHYDIGYLYRASVNDRVLVSHESNALEWVSFEDAPKIAHTGSMKRFIRKAIAAINEN